MSSRRMCSERGVVFPYLILVMGALFAATAAGVGFGRMTLIATEAQNAADVAALAGAAAQFKGGTPMDEAQVALGDNRIDNKVPMLMLQEITTGTYSFEDRSFSTNGFLVNAVRSRVLTDYANPFGALIGHNAQTVEKIAYASFTGLRGARPTLPIVVGECHFEDDCLNDLCMPRLTQAPANTDNSGWTAFFDVASTPGVKAYFPEVCDGEGKVQEIWIGDVIKVQNGQAVPLLNAVDCLIDEGMTHHLIPIVPCGGQYNQTKVVLGFATVVLDFVKTNGSKKGIDLHAIFKSNAIGALGGRDFGSGNIVLVPVND